MAGATAAAPVSVALRSRVRRVRREAIGRELRRIREEALKAEVPPMADDEFEAWVDELCARNPNV